MNGVRSQACGMYVPLPMQTANMPLLVFAKALFELLLHLLFGQLKADTLCQLAVAKLYSSHCFPLAVHIVWQISSAGVRVCLQARPWDSKHSKYSKISPAFLVLHELRHLIPPNLCHCKGAILVHCYISTEHKQNKRLNMAKLPQNPTGQPGLSDSHMSHMSLLHGGPQQIVTTPVRPPRPLKRGTDLIL